MKATPESWRLGAQLGVWGHRMALQRMVWQRYPSRLAQHEGDLSREVIESVSIRNDTNRWLRGEQAG